MSPSKNPVHVSTLPNGLRVVTCQLPQVETVSMGMWVGVGSRYESEKNQGIAHFLEHMAFKGTEKYSSFDIAQKIEQVGGDLNAATGQEMTYYYASLLKADLELGVEILADILQNSTFLQEEIERERRVVLQEIDQTEDTPEDIIFDHFQKVAFPDQPLGRAILGTKKTVNSLTQETLKAFVKEHYLPNNMVFSAAGNLDHETVVRFVEKYFFYPKVGKKLSYAPGIYKGGVSHVFKKLEQQHLILGFEGVPVGRADVYVAHCYASILGGGMSSRLFQEIREKRGLVYGISAFSYSYQDSGVFGVYTGTSEDKIDEIIKIIYQEIEKSVESLTEEEVERSKNQLKAQIFRSQEKTSYRAYLMAKQLLNLGHLLSAEELLKKIEEINPKSLKKFGETILNSPPSCAFIGPRKEDIVYKKE